MFSDRLAYIKNLNGFLSNSKSSLDNILDEFRWKKPDIDISLTKNQDKVICPNDRNHVVPENSLQKHVAQCSLKKDGYNEICAFFPPCNETGKHIIVIDEKIQENILKNFSFSSNTSSGNCIQKRSVPQTSDRLLSDFTPAERCAIYDYAVKNTSQGLETSVDDVNLPFNKTQGNLKPKSLEELLAAERDAKRRRIRYKSKKVHTGRKTQTEVLREVIQSQMEGYEEWLQQQCYQLSGKLPDDLSSNVEKTSNDGNFVVVDNANNCKEIIRDWDDWNYYYKGNPHKRYIKVIEEERDREDKKKDEKLLKRDDIRVSKNYRRYAKDDKCTISCDRYEKQKDTSIERERSCKTDDYEDHRRLYDDKYNRINRRGDVDHKNFKGSDDKNHRRDRRTDADYGIIKDRNDDKHRKYKIRDADYRNIKGKNDSYDSCSTDVKHHRKNKRSKNFMILEERSDCMKYDKGEDKRRDTDYKNIKERSVEKYDRYKHYDRKRRQRSRSRSEKSQESEHSESSQRKFRDCVEEGEYTCSKGKHKKRDQNFPESHLSSTSKKDKNYCHKKHKSKSHKHYISHEKNISRASESDSSSSKTESHLSFSY